MSATRADRSTRHAPAHVLLWLVPVCALAACDLAPAHPGASLESARPENELRFAVLYKDNCAGCHGENGRDGAAIALANPVLIAYAKDNLRDVIAKGVPGTLMPAFARGSGGMLTDQQVSAIADGIANNWGDTKALAGQTAPPWTTTLKGDAARGEQAYGVFCARCHGAHGEGGVSDAKMAAPPTGASKTGSIVDPSYLALISDQGLRNITIAGRPDQAMPDWQSDAVQPMTDQQVTDIVAWMASKRVATPGQPYPAPQSP
jgi:cytochrome c oxidase cbb3-type subunit 3/ubiquinol-cytochrome c reductase cytochrome c subunit